MKTRLVCFALAAFFLSSGQACVAVKPWERELLSHPSMQLTARLGDGFRPHILSIREGSTGGESTVGGGCGCN